MSDWEKIVREHGPPTYRSAWRILRQTEDCEDCLQDVFVEAHRLYLAGKVTHWRTFLSRLVTFRALDLLRRRKKTTSLDHMQLFDASIGPEAAVIAADDIIRVRELIAELPKHQAAVFCLAHLEELSHVEIANTLNITTNAVALALHKARASLRQLVEKSTKENQNDDEQ